jgi:hypothetical protein
MQEENGKLSIQKNKTPNGNNKKTLEIEAETAWLFCSMAAAAARPRRAFAALLLASSAQGLVVTGLARQATAVVGASRAAAPAMKASRRFAAVEQEVEKEKLYTPEEAVALMKKLATAKFPETAELHGNLNLDPKYNDQQVRRGGERENGPPATLSSWARACRHALTPAASPACPTL